MLSPSVEAPCRGWGSLAGRIVNRRSASSKLIFYDLRQGGKKLQIVCSATSMPQLAEVQARLARGDLVGPCSGYSAMRPRQLVDRLLRWDAGRSATEVRGFPGKTSAGELSVWATKVSLLAPCLHPLPLDEGLADPVRCWAMQGMLTGPAANARSNRTGVYVCVCAGRRRSGHAPATSTCW